MNYEKFDKIKVKQARELIKEYHGKLVDDLCKEFHTDVYSLSNGKALVIYDRSHAFLHNTLENVYKFKEAANALSGKVSHILEGRLPEQSEVFLEQKDKIIEVFLNRLSLTGLQPNRLENLKQIDAALKLILKKHNVPDLYMPGFIAFIGECIKCQVRESDWVIINYGETKIWEPYIKDSQGIIYNPFLIAYKELYESFPEEGTIDSFDLAFMEIKMPITLSNK